MNHLEFITDYKAIDKYRLSFNKLAHKTFGIDFEKWYQHGFWDDTYVCYSYIVQNEVVSNVSVSKLNIIIDNKEYKALQLGTVMTRPDYRGKGLSKSLMEIVLHEYESKCDLIYLFANKNVLEYYPKFGFKRIAQCRYSINITGKNRPVAVRKLDITKEDDIELIRKISGERIPISQALSIKNGKGILAWYCMNVYNENLYYLVAEDIMIIYNIENETLHLYDVVSKNQIALKHLLQKICKQEVKKIVFYFTPDNHGLQINKEVYDDKDDTLFVKSSRLSFLKEIAYPVTAHA